MAEDARALMDALMGVQRDNAPPSNNNNNSRNNASRPSNNNNCNNSYQQIRTRSCYDNSVCPMFCAWGVDVYELFRNTKSDFGINPRLPDKEARAHWLSLSTEGKRRHGGERELLQLLQTMVANCDRVVIRNKEKLKKESFSNIGRDEDSALRIDEELVNTAAELTADYDHLAKHIDTCDDAIKLSSILSSLETIESKLKQVKRFINQEYNQVCSAKPSKMLVCEISGNFLSSKDDDGRIAAHFKGKMWEGWYVCRSKCKELLDRGVGAGGGGDGGRGRGGYGYSDGYGGGGGDRNSYDDRDRNIRDRDRDRYSDDRNSWRNNDGPYHGSKGGGGGRGGGGYGGGGGGGGGGGYREDYRRR